MRMVGLSDGLLQVAEDRSGESLISFEFNQLLTGMDFRHLL
jgi:hypothetical protein